MDLSEIPFDIPVIFHSPRTNSNLQNVVGSKQARCHHDNKDVYEELILRRVGDDKVAIQAARNGRFLHVRVSGECVFDAKEIGDCERFQMETDNDCNLYFVSCHTGNVLQCGDNGVVRCANENRQSWEAWRIMEPRGSLKACVPNAVGNVDDRDEVRSRRAFVLELAKSGMAASDIQQIVLSLFNGPTASQTNAPESASACAIPLKKQ